MGALDTTVTDLGHGLLSLGNHVIRTPLALLDDQAERLAYAARECDRLATELRNAADEARAQARRFAL